MLTALNFFITTQNTRPLATPLAKKAVLCAHFSIISEGIQKVTPSDTHLIAHIKNLKINAQWNPGQYDIEYLLQSRQVELAVRFSNNQPVGYMSLFKSGNFSFFGSLITEPAQRNKGFGKDLWQYTLAHATQTTGLYGVTHMVPYYAKSGFEQTGTVRRITFSLPTQKSISGHEDTTSVLPQITPYQLNSICAFDRTLTGIERGDLLRVIINDRAHTITSTTLTTNGSLFGYGLLRPLMQGFRLSLYANDTATAALILRNIINVYSQMHHAPNTNGGLVVADVPEERLDITANVLKELSLSPTISPKKDFQLCAMFLNPNKEADTQLSNGCFGLLSLEVG